MVKKNRSFRSWEEIRADVVDMANMSCRPSKQKVRADHVFDEDKSVKWNREQVEVHNAAVAQETKDLNTAKNKRRDELLEETLSHIIYDLDDRIDKDGARQIWDYAYEAGHSYGVQEVFIYLDNLISLFRSVMKIER